MTYCFESKDITILSRLGKKSKGFDGEPPWVYLFNGNERLNAFHCIELLLLNLFGFLFFLFGPGLAVSTAVYFSSFAPNIAFTHLLTSFVI